MPPRSSSETETLKQGENPVAHEDSSGSATKTTVLDRIRDLAATYADGRPEADTPLFATMDDLDRLEFEIAVEDEYEIELLDAAGDDGPNGLAVRFPTYAAFAAWIESQSAKAAGPI